MKMNKSEFGRYVIRQSGDGWEVLCEGRVIAWTIEHGWALRVLTALESIGQEQKY